MTLELLCNCKSFCEEIKMFPGGGFSVWQSTLIFRHWPLWEWVFSSQYRKWVIRRNKKVLYNMFDQGAGAWVFVSSLECLCRCFWPKQFWHSTILKNWTHYFPKHCIVELWRRSYSGLRGTICASLQAQAPWKALSHSLLTGRMCEVLFLCPSMTWPFERQT